MRRYFRRDGDWEGLGRGSVWLEFEGNTATRQAEVYDGMWYASADEFHPELGGSLTDAPLGEHAFLPEEEISAVEFEEAWGEALRHRSQAAN